jgi:hypothetical protein
MKTIPSEKSNRCWTVAELPQPHKSDLEELEICVNYTDQGNAAKGIAIDSFVVPLFRLAPRLLEAVHSRTVGDLATMGLTKEELDEVKRLCGDHSIKRK